MLKLKRFGNQLENVAVPKMLFFVVQRTEMIVDVQALQAVVHPARQALRQAPVALLQVVVARVVAAVLRVLLRALAVLAALHRVVLLHQVVVVHHRAAPLLRPLVVVDVLKMNHIMKSLKSVVLSWNQVRALYLLKPKKVYVQA